MFSNIKILGLVGLFLLVIALVVFFRFISPSTTSRPTPLNTPVATVKPSSVASPASSIDERLYSEEYKKEAAETNKQEQSQIEKDKLVAKFIDTLPYKGSFFSASLNLNTGRVEIVIDDANKAQGEVEFDEYLKNNQITDRSWIQNLSIKYE